MTSPFIVSPETGGTRLSAGSGADHARHLRQHAASDLATHLIDQIESVQQPVKAVEAVVSTLIDEGLAVAHLAMLPGTSWVAAGATSNGLVQSSRATVGRPQAQALHELIQTGTTQRWLLPPDTPDRVRLLSTVFGETELTERIEEAASRELMFFPLRARGQGFGLLSVAFGGDSRLRPEAVGALELLVERIAVALDTCALLAEGRYLAMTMREALTPTLPLLDRIELGLWSRVADGGLGLGGDFVAVTGDETDLSVVVGDAMGKGVEAAVTAKRLHAGFRTAARVDRRPDWVVDVVNQVASEESDEYAGLFTTAACLRARPAEDGSLRVDISSAGHCPALIVRGDGSVEATTARGPALGLYSAPEFPSESFTLHPGDAVIVYTDGINEAQGDVEPYGDQRLAESAARLAGLRASVVAERVGLDVDAFADRLRDQDDRTVLVMRCPSVAHPGGRA